MNTVLDTVQLEMWDKNIEIARQDILNTQVRTKVVLAELGGLRSSNAVLERYEKIIPDQTKLVGGAGQAEIQFARVFDLIDRDITTNDAIIADPNTTKDIRSTAAVGNILLRPLRQDWAEIIERMDMAKQAGREFMPTPKTLQEYDALPSGTHYLDEDGESWIKG